MSRSTRSSRSRALLPQSNVWPRQTDERDVFDYFNAATKTKKRNDYLRSYLFLFSRPRYVGALAFVFFVSPCFATLPTWAQTPGNISSPLVIDREKEIDATRFSSGIYGDPSPNNPSPFVEAPTSSAPQLPPFFSGETADAIPNAARKQLEALAWALGSWELESGGFVFQTKIDWAPGGSYLLCRDFVRPAVAPSLPSSASARKEASATPTPTPQFAALRVIGWNPVAGLFQSSIFCRDGSYGTGIWQREGESWRVATRILLVDGRAATSVEYFSPRPGGGFDWESTARTVENTTLPNIGPATARSLPPSALERLENSIFSNIPSPLPPTSESEFE